MLCLRASLLAATVLGVHGCMSSPAEQLAAINSAPNQKRNTTQSNAAQLPSDADIADQSSIANQANADADLLNSDSAPALDSAPVNADQPVTDADVMVGKKNIAAAQASIFASPETATVPDAADSQAVTLDGAENGAQTQALNAAQNSIYAGAVDTIPRETASIPLPDASKVSEVQDLALAGMEIPVELEQQVASADAADPQLAEQALELTPITPTQSLEEAQAQEVATAAVEERVQPVRKRRTLADFFSSDSDEDAFDTNRFAQKPRRKSDTNAIPNMQTAALGEEQLPGVNANAMFATGNLSEDEHSEDDDQPAGLMKLASLSGMTRAAPNGLWTQTDKCAACARNWSAC